MELEEKVWDGMEGREGKQKLEVGDEAERKQNEKKKQERNISEMKGEGDWL